MQNMRRNDRAISEEDALVLLANGEYGVISTVGRDGQPYGVPVNYCVIGRGIYFHCAVEGHKIDNITHNPRVSFCVVGNTRVLPRRFTTQYRSAIVFGVIGEVFEDEKQTALEGLLKKYSADFFEKGVKYIEASGKKTRVFKISITEITGKARK